MSTMVVRSENLSPRTHSCTTDYLPPLMNSRMRIAQIGPLAERIPPKKYGGTERVVHALTESLVARGHEVTLFASGDSLTSAHLVSVYPQSLREANLKDIYGANVWSLLNIGTAFERQAEFDIIHDHLGYLTLPTANIAHTPVVSTMHGAFTREMNTIYNRFRRPYVVSISDAQRVTAPHLNYIGTVYNGLPMADYPFSAEHDGYLLFVGRISMEKGVHLAVEVARDMGLPLIIAAKLDPMNKPYFKEYIEPWLSDKIRWIGEVDEEERNKLYSRAMAFLHPITWREPFGLTLIEAMACGCPVIAIGKGSIPEIVKHGKTGFVVEDVEEMEDAVGELDTIDRRACRRHALTNFSAERMTDRYIAVYEEILSRNGTQGARPIGASGGHTRRARHSSR